MGRRIALLSLAVLLGATAGCASGEPTAAAVEGASLERTTVASTTIPSTTVDGAADVQLLPPTHVSRSELEAAAIDWEGQTYDFGVVRRVARVGEVWHLVFDREQIHDVHGVRDGPTLEMEPVLIGDPPGIRILNNSPKLRTFAVSPNVEILRLAPSWNCTTDLPSWVRINLDQLAASPSTGGDQDALTFDTNGQVTRIRLARGC